jgi:DNA-binding response OmpR family regulator
MTNKYDTQSQRQPAVLLVHNLDQTFLVDELSEAGYTVQTAVSLPEALTVIQQRRTDLDLVITDWLPSLNGPELAGMIKERWPDLPVIIYTAYGTNVVMTGPNWWAADDYVVKTADLNELLERVSILLKSRQQLDTTTPEIQNSQREN